MVPFFITNVSVYKNVKDEFLHVDGLNCFLIRGAYRFESYNLFVVNSNYGHKQLIIHLELSQLNGRTESLESRLDQLQSQLTDELQ